MPGPGLEEWWRYPVRFPGCASHFFWVCWEGIFFDFYTCWGMLGDTFETLFGGVGVTFWSGWGHFFVISGMSWEVSGSGPGTFLDRFWKVLKKMSDGVRKLTFSKMAGSIFPESGRFRIAFLAYPRSKNKRKI